MSDPIRVAPESLGLDHVPEGSMGRTYLDHAEEGWFSSVWDIARVGDTFQVYRKGNWRITVGSFDLALAIVEDDRA